MRKEQLPLSEGALSGVPGEGEGYVEGREGEGGGEEREEPKEAGGEASGSNEEGGTEGDWGIVVGSERTLDIAAAQRIAASMAKTQGMLRLRG